MERIEEERDMSKPIEDRSPAGPGSRSRSGKPLLSSGAERGPTVKGRPLPPGGTVGIVAPASPYYNRSAVLRGVEWWEDRGYHVKLAPGIYERQAYLAGDASSRARDLEAMFLDPEVHVIQCFQGGFGSTEVLDQLDLGMIAEHPKAFVGKSDITSLHAAFVGRARLATFYGPGLINVNAVGVSEFTQERLLRALTATEPLGDVPINPDDQYVRSLGAGVARATIVGGALWVLALTVGTPWQVDLHGKVLFVEEVGEQPWRLDALLTNLRQTDALDGVVAVVVGELIDCDWREDRSDFPQTFSAEDVLERHIASLGVPAIYGLPLGHGKNLVTIPLGVEVEVDGDARRLSIVESALADSETPLPAAKRALPATEALEANSRASAWGLP
jgi:muramoyltetrapeptide carboxypeptidase